MSAGTGERSRDSLGEEEEDDDEEYCCSRRLISSVIVFLLFRSHGRIDVVILRHHNIFDLILLKPLVVLAAAGRTAPNIMERNNGLAGIIITTENVFIRWAVWTTTVQFIFLARVEASLCTAVVVFTFPYQVLRYYRSTHEKILLMNITPNPIPDYPS